MAKPRKQTYTMEMYLKKMEDQDIRSDADVQRLAGQWSAEMVNELIVTVLSDDYIPPIILGEELNSQLWIIDGLQRCTSLRMFRYANIKITSLVDNPIISYRSKAKDENGHVKYDNNGDIVWEEKEFDIKNKTYKDLPEELKKKFNEYQIETVIHENCDMKQISMLIKRYNNHLSMNNSQKAFTYIDNFAREIRDMVNSRFFLDCGKYTEKDKTKGNLERVIVETIMCTSHLDEWKKQTKQIATYLNKNATIEEFTKLADNLHRLEKVITEDVKDIFDTKNSFIWLTLFNKFTELNLEDSKFVEFLRAFKTELRENIEVNGETFAMVDLDRGTKDKSLIKKKLLILEEVMYYFFLISPEDLEKVDVLEFVKENVNPEATEEDVELYSDILDDLTLNVNNNTKLLDEHNRPSMVALVGYACKNDIDLEEWIKNFFVTNFTYKLNQRQNYLAMIRTLQKGAVA